MTPDPTVTAARLEDLIYWLDKKYSRHHEEEDKEAADALREYAALRARSALSPSRAPVTAVSELKPCPFCGHWTGMVRGTDDGAMIVECARCLAIGPGGKDEARAIASWNIRARSALADVGEWQKIETAPEDGTSVLIYCEGWREGSEAHYIPDHGWHLANVDNTDNHGRAFYPTHWQPLPAAPGTGKQPRLAAEAKCDHIGCAVTTHFGATTGDCTRCGQSFVLPTYPLSPAAHTAQGDAKAMRCYYVTAHTQGFVNSPLWHELAEETRETYRQHVSHLAEQGSGAKESTEGGT